MKRWNAEVTLPDGTPFAFILGVQAEDEAEAERLVREGGPLTPPTDAVVFIRDADAPRPVPPEEAPSGQGELL